VCVCARAPACVHDCVSVYGRNYLEDLGIDGKIIFE
jgi:hypothetical protein